MANKRYNRLLKGYSLDPGFSTQLDTMGVNEITYDIRWESELKPGPVGEYFEVIDYDPATGCFYDPVDLNSIDVLARNGLPPSEGNPMFHQQFVYTIAMNTLDHFEKSLGRKVIWAQRVLENGTREYVSKLRLFPHAIRDANAYYDPEKKSVLFGYFEADSGAKGSNIPGGVVFTCLSPDIVAHELTHAILDSIHPRFNENTNRDVPAFHEAFADLAALLQRFTISPLVEHQIAKTRGNLTEFSFLGELATQFGTAIEGGRGALRGAIGGVNRKGEWEKFKPDPKLYNTVFEPHARGSILVSVVFDAFVRLYNVKTSDLLRIATNGSGIIQPGAIHPDLVKRLAKEACGIAEHLLHICIRALDYCPPVDITFGDYFRALITADIDAAPRDGSGYRVALIEAFRSWGIFPEKVNTLSEESLAWTKPENFSEDEEIALTKIAKKLKGWVSKIMDLSAQESNFEEKYDDDAERDGKHRDLREKIYVESQKAQAKLHDLMVNEKQEFLGPEGWTAFLVKLGLTNKAVKFTYKGEEISSPANLPLEVHKVRPVYRIGREGTLIEQVMITLTQTFHIDKGNLKGATFRGGCTIILNMSRGFEVEYIIYKNIASQRRFEMQMDYQSGESDDHIAFTASAYEQMSGFDKINFAKLHFH